MAASGQFAVEFSDTTIRLVQANRDGGFSRVAGVLTLNGLDILAASAHTENGMALAEFEIRGGVDYDVHRLTAQLHAGSEGRLALDARVDDRRRVYSRKRRSAQPIVPNVTFDNTTSDVATVIEVSGPDEVGLLYRIARALAELGVAVASARIQTIGDAVVDAFYVTNEGEKILDAAHLDEIERAVLHAIHRR